MVWKPFQQVLSDWQCCSSPCFVADINNRPRGIGTPAGKWLQAACSHQDFTWMRLEEERRAKPSGWYFGKLAFPYQSDPAGSCHSFLSGDYMVLCALEDQQLQQVQLLSWRSVKILLQSCSAGMLPWACSHISIWRNNKGLLSVGLAPSSCSGHQLGDDVLINLRRC